MPEPGRGAWRFRNVRREFQFWPTLESIEITQEYPDVTATMTLEVVDGGEGYQFEAQDEVRAFFQKSGEAEVRIFAGHLVTVTEDAESEFGPRKWLLRAQDYTAKLGHAIIRQQEQRKGESAIARIRWIVSYLDNAWHVDDKDYEVPDEAVERQDMYGMTVAEALDSVANEVGLRFWIDLDNVLHVHKATTIPAPFALDNDDPDFVTSFPFREFTYTRDSLELGNAVLVEPEKRRDSRWAVAPSNIANYEWGDSTGRQERFIAAEEIRTARAAARHADVQLQRTKAQDVECSLVCFEPGLYAGMRVSLTEALWGHTAQMMRITRVVITALDPHDEDGLAYLRSELTLTNKPHRRQPKMGRTEGESANTGTYTLDDFNRDVPAPTTEPGASIGAFSPYTLTWGEEVYLHSGFLGSAVYLGPGAPFGPTLSAGGPLFQQVASNTGLGNVSWPTTPAIFACGLGGGSWGGWREREKWGRLTIPAHPANMAGVRLTISIGNAAGAAAAKGCIVYARSSPPSVGRSGTVVGRIGVGATSLLIPCGLIPAAGGDLWVGVGPAWEADYDYSEVTRPDGYPAACTVKWAWPATSGEHGSGTANATIGSAAWELWDGDAVVLGTMPPGGDAPWEGGNALNLGNTEGSPIAYGIDGDALYLTGEVPSSLTVYAAGTNADPDQPSGPWSEGAWSLEVHFTVSASGDTAEAGAREIEVTTIGNGIRTVGKVHLGDATAAEGISVAGPTDTDYAAKPIGVGELWIARFDSRSGDFRGKLWRASDGQPAEWDVEAAITPTEDDDDRFVLTIRAGNGTGDSQTVRILDLRAAVAASPGMRVIQELLGRASGATNQFKTDHPFRAGTMFGYVNGVADTPTWTDPDETLFKLDWPPTAESIIRAEYIAAG